MEILQLRYFFQSTYTQNFAKTAEKYMVPTSSVSASVKRLETELGCTLFDRSSNRIILNSNGKRLQRALEHVFSELERAVEDLSVAFADTREIKMLVRAMRSKITDCIIEYNKNHPQIVFNTVFDFGETDFENYDIIIDEQADAYPDYEKFQLCSMRLRMRVSEDSPLCGRRLTLNQLSGQRFVSLGEQSNMHKILLSACKNAGFTPKISVLCNDIECHEKLIESGLGIGLGREIHKGEDFKKIRCLDVADFNESYVVYGYYKKHAAYGNVKHFLDFLTSKAI